jgi:NTE family protein
MTIKHLVFSGGGPIMIQILAAIQELENRQYLNMNNIETIYGTSAGAIIAVMISLNFDWETLNDYIIKRPWHDLFSIKVQNILESYTKKGIFDSKIVEKCFKPLFDAKDISLEITLEEFFKLTKKEIHLFTFEINEYKLFDISYKTHPDLKLLDAVQMSCALPVLITPVFIDDKCFMDGGIACNYPLQFCIESGKNPDETLGFKNKYSDNKTIINSKSTLLDHILNFLFKAILSMESNYIQPIIKNQVICDTSYVTFDTLSAATTSIEVRKDLFDKGREAAIQFLELQNSI